MKAKKLSFRMILVLFGILPVIVTILAIGIFNTSMIDNLIMSELESELHSVTALSAERFEEFARGTDKGWSMENDVLNIGYMQIEQDSPFFDAALDENIYLTLFWGDTRYGTSIRDEAGNRVVGTKASDAVIEKVLHNGQNYFISHVNIVGQDFSGYYVPLRDGNEIIGMMFSGKPYADTAEQIRQIGIKIFMIAIFIVVFVGLVIFFVSRIISKKMKDIHNVIKSISDGDFTTLIENKNKIKEFYEIADDMENMRANLQNVLANIIEHAKDVNEHAIDTMNKISDNRQTTSNIDSAVSELANGATSMAQEVQDTMNVTTSIGDAIDKVMESAQSNLSNGRIVYENAQNVQTQLEKLQKSDEETDCMAQQISESATDMAMTLEKISGAAEAIINIASETNLLALNASIEAARAGEAGRGFAVVAENIKQLAEDSNKTASEITSMLGEISQQSGRNKDLTDRIKNATSSEKELLDGMVDSFMQMQELLKETEKGNETISKMVESMTKDKNLILNSVEGLSSVSEEYAASTQETSAAIQLLNQNMENMLEESEGLQQIARELRDNTNMFHVKAGEI